MKSISGILGMAAFLTVFLGMTASCNSNKSDDQEYQDKIIARYYPQYECFIDKLGSRLTLKDATIQSALENSMYRFDCAYKTSEYKGGVQPITLTTVPKNLKNLNISIGEAPKPDQALYALSLNSAMQPEMFDKDFLLIPVMFWSQYFDDDNADLDVPNHRFSITYDPANDKELEPVMKLTLTDNLISEQSKDRKIYTFSFQAFDISGLIERFLKTHTLLSTIKVVAQVNSNTADPLDDFTKEDTFSLTYGY